MMAQRCQLAVAIALGRWCAKAAKPSELCIPCRRPSRCSGIAREGSRRCAGSRPRKCDAATHLIFLRSNSPPQPRPPLSPPQRPLPRPGNHPPVRGARAGHLRSRGDRAHSHVVHGHQQLDMPGAAICGHSFEHQAGPTHSTRTHRRRVAGETIPSYSRRPPQSLNSVWPTTVWR